jgi:hypothetical protein
MIAIALLLAQMITPSDAREERQFHAAQAVAERAGWSEPAVFWHQGEAFVLEAGKDLERHLLFLDGKTVYDLGKSGQLRELSAEVKPIFPDVLDIILTKEPFMYETSLTEVSHDLIAHGRVVCHIAGSSRSSTAKGPNTWESRREVKLEPLGDTLVVTSTEETVVRPHRGQGEEKRTAGPSSTKRYTFPPGGDCKGSQ